MKDSNGDAPDGTVQSILFTINSPHANSGQRIEALERLEKYFGGILLGSTGQSAYERRIQRETWWHIQSKPNTCVALALVSHLHRIHSMAEVLMHTSWNSDTGADLEIAGEMTTCFTILQGLCLKHDESRHICERPSTLQLLLCILLSSYWALEKNEEYTLVHALDLLICITMASKSAAGQFQSLNGEEAVRTLMDNNLSKESNPPSVPLRGHSKNENSALNEAKGNAVAMKCAELLLLLASEDSDHENFVAGIPEKDRKPMRSLSNFMNRNAFQHDSASYRTSPERAPRDASHHRLSRSSSPVKDIVSQGRLAREERFVSKIAKDERRQVSPVSPLQPCTAPTSHDFVPPTKSYPPVRTSVSARLSARAALRDRIGKDGRPKTPSLGDPRDFSTRDGQDRSLLRYNLSLSPSKTMMGPSPAVKRAQARRSLSPQKKKSISKRSL